MISAWIQEYLFPNRPPCCFLDSVWLDWHESAESSGSNETRKRFNCRKAGQKWSCLFCLLSSLIINNTINLLCWIRRWKRWSAHLKKENRGQPSQGQPRFFAIHIFTLAILHLEEPVPLPWSICICDPPRLTCHFADNILSSLCHWDSIPGHSSRALVDKYQNWQNWQVTIVISVNYVISRERCMANILVASSEVNLVMIRCW